MFLTTFDKKMYEEAVRIDARAEVEAEMNERCEKLEREKEVLFFRNEELSSKNQELTQMHIRDQREQAKTLKQKGVSYDIARVVITKISPEELAEIYGE